MKLASLLFAALVAASPAVASPTPKSPARDFDILIVHGRVFDGAGGPGRLADVGVKGDRIVAIGHLAGRHTIKVIDAAGMAVAPGFINMLSQAGEDLLIDGHSQSDIRQGVTLEMLGEGMTAGPLSPSLRDFMHARMARLGAGDVAWTTQADYMRLLVSRGVSPNVASFVGATNVRRVVIGDGDRKATEADLKAMEDLIRQAMADGAFGVSSALGYAPAAYADTAELTRLAKASAPWNGLYISHLRDEGDNLPAAVDELIKIARDAGVKGEVYHFKVIGVGNEAKLDRAIAAIETARREGLRVGADAYPYTATATGLDVTMPLWVQAGGQQAWIDRLKDPDTRHKVAEEMRHPPPGVTSRLQAVGSPENIRILGVRNPTLKPLVGKSIAEVAKLRGVPPEEAIIDLVVEDNSRLQVAYFSVPESGVRKVLSLPWVSFGSDGGSTAVPSRSPGAAHPREYGAFARLLGHYVREEKVIGLAQAIHRLSGLPAANLGLTDRGLLKPGYFADIVVFDPKVVADRATYEQPFQYAVGVRDVLVNGTPVLANGEHTGATPGRFIRNSGRKD